MRARGHVNPGNLTAARRYGELVDSIVRGAGEPADIEDVLRRAGKTRECLAADVASERNRLEFLATSQRLRETQAEWNRLTERIAEEKDEAALCRLRTEKARMQVQAHELPVRRTELLRALE